MDNVKKSLFFLFFSISAAFLPVNADTINVTSVSGVWTNAQGSSGLPDNFSGGGTNVIHWGFPTTPAGNSGYQFVGNAPLNNLQLDTPFALGTFTHFNFPITGDSLTSVDLNVSILININGSPIAFDGVYHFLHNETPNNFNPVTNPNNNDIVKFENNVAQSDTINIGGIDYTIGILGFLTSPNGSLVQQFSTVETRQNDATLFAQISRPQVFVPEPSTYLLLGSLISAGSFIAAARRRKQII